MELNSLTVGNSNLTWMFLLEFIFTALTGTVSIIKIINYLYEKWQAKKDEEAKSRVDPYLTNFNDDDIKLKRSPTGGWNGFHLNIESESICSTRSSTSRNDEPSKSNFEVITIDDCLNDKSEVNQSEYNTDIEKGNVSSLSPSKSTLSSSLRHSVNCRIKEESELNKHFSLSPDGVGTDSLRRLTSLKDKIDKINC